ncbi:MAG: nitroreductase [Bacteroidales bacterium]|nr:nitroreductase [Bacteroidales bacterium]
MTLQEAIVARHSVRQYQEKAIEAGKIEQLKAAIEEANREAGLHLQLVTDEPEAFAQGMAKYGKFSDVSNYIALVCRKGKDELLGYHGERIVLLAQTLGLNSCWVGLTFSRQPDRYTVGSGETLHGVIALGYGATPGVQHPMKPVEKYYKAQGAVPDWFRRGMEAALLAPTAMNMQKFEFELLPDGTVAARTRFSLVGSYLKIDLGIVKCHFELGAGKENFRWA